ncbi:unnamed protein product [Cuscuta epithymum]|uniref:Uncharacterized protein n=1 Tax=Cuscuta epithymum TaxID=186058 RepID=A0AAV0G4F1_9ASTE|nr:unnamed protein product [Cuscuta epithymum]
MEFRKEKDEKEFQLKEQVMKKEIELKENDQKLKEKAQKSRDEDRAMKLEQERRQDQRCILNQDLSKLSESVRTSYEIMQTEILKEWKKDGLFKLNICVKCYFKLVYQAGTLSFS